MCRIGLLVSSCWIAALLPTANHAQEVADRQISLTIYNQDLALIQHVRPMSVPAGRHRIEFEGVSPDIVSETVSFLAPGLELIEQNFDYDLLTPSKLMEKAVGQQVQIVRTIPGTGTETRETAEVLSTTGGVVLRIDERIEVLREDGLPARVIFDRVPPNLRASPTLSVLVRAEEGVSDDITLAYLSRGFSWSADYVAVLDETAGSIAMQGWITLENTSGTTFADARVQLVAGDVNIVDSRQQWLQDNRRRLDNATRRAGTETSARGQLADYYVYPLDEPTTIANNQTKQVSFLNADGVAAERGYARVFSRFESSDAPLPADVRIRFSNSSAGGLGEQLPSGIVRVYARDARGQPQFVGEDLIGHTSTGSDVAVRIGEAFDVTVQPTLLETSRVSNRDTDYVVSYRVTNARAVPITVTVVQGNLRRFNELIEESLPGRRTSADSLAWDVPVPANGEAELTVTIREGR